MTVEDFDQLSSNEASKFADDFKGLPEIDSLEGAEEAVERLDQLYEEYSDEDNKIGMRHAILVGEIGHNRARNNGDFEIADLYSEWVEEKKK